VCRLCNYDGLTAEEQHLIIREAYRNYLTFQEFVANNPDSNDVIEYAVPKSDDSDEYVTISISFTDLQRALKRYRDGLRAEGTVLSKRKEQAFYLNVIRDMKQKDVAKLMDITTVSVGQYVDQGMLQLCDYYFAEQQDTQQTLTSETMQEQN
jgi:DNA-directed RNA polymerase specialized sigma subunit